MGVMRSQRKMAKSKGKKHTYITCHQPWLEWDFVSCYSVNPFRALWVAVLQQAFADLTANTRVFHNENAMNKSLVMNWFFRGHPTHAYDGFIDVCEFAGFNPKYVRQCAFKIAGKEAEK